MQYNLLDKFKNIPLQHRRLTILVLSSIILLIFLSFLCQSFAYKYKEQEENFDEIQQLINEIKENDKEIVNQTKVVEIARDVKGVDISGWQGKIDWQALKNSGIDFAMIRVGVRKLNDGEIVEDSYFKYNIEQANYYDVPVGVYFFSSAKNEYEVIEEATFTLNLIKNYKITYPVAYDFESFESGRVSKVSDEVINYNALVFLDYMKSHGYNGMLYGNKTAMETRWDLSRFSNYKKWLAHYMDGVSYKGNYDMWQYTDIGRVNGILADVDLNEAYFAYEIENVNDEIE